jgi:hypothetical protein
LDGLELRFEPRRRSGYIVRLVSQAIWEAEGNRPPVTPWRLPVPKGVQFGYVVQSTIWEMARHGPRASSNETNQLPQGSSVEAFFF